ncbi:AEC family transporter [Rhizosaccharibacter radicis]|uniref:AEC family transporter n=1 Tax=Rhizosaccharibacter radicis TaxID=2782605 RepID=A0ABT1VXZ7_9PROT|nr:AEC family transporter [Acetobacteraceae bacterium KSS12]
MNSVSQALAPVVVTLALGILAGWRGLFDAGEAAAINRMVLRFCLPLALFAGIMNMSREAVLSSGPLAMLILFGMLGGYGAALLLAWRVAGRGLTASVLQALAIGNPSVPFIGTVVLGTIVGPTSALPISLASLTINIVLVPATLLLLAADPDRDDAARDGVADGIRPTPAPAGAPGLGSHLRHALGEPVVWAPVLALLLVLCGLRMPHALLPNFTLLGQATGGVALFAAGVILFLNRPSLDRAVVASVLARNVLVPCAVWGVALGAGVGQAVLREAVVTMSMPTASMVVILASRVDRGQREASSVLFFSTVLSVATMAVFIVATG